MKTKARRKFVLVLNYSYVTKTKSLLYFVLFSSFRTSQLKIFKKKENAENRFVI